MNENEKETLKLIKGIYQAGFNGRLIDRNDIKDILNIIEKQQKEIEKLKDELKEERALNVEVLNTLKECVHKDKIREKLKKSKKEYEHYEKENLENLMRMTAGEIVMLEELLGE